MPDNNQMMSVEGQLVGMPLAGPESFSQQQLEYLKRALGVDETVLFENASGASESNGFTVSEKFTNFERIRLVGATNDANYCVDIPTYADITSTFRFAVSCMAKDSDGARLQVYGKSFTSSNGLTYSLYASPARWFSNSTVTSVNGLASLTGKIFKIVGINRISGGNT